MAGAHKTAVEGQGLASKRRTHSPELTQKASAGVTKLETVAPWGVDPTTSVSIGGQGPGGPGHEKAEARTQRRRGPSGSSHRASAGNAALDTLTWGPQQGRRFLLFCSGRCGAPCGPLGLAWRTTSQGVRAKSSLPIKVGASAGSNGVGASHTRSTAALGPQSCQHWQELHTLCE